MAPRTRADTNAGLGTVDDVRLASRQWRNRAPQGEADQAAGTQRIYQLRAEGVDAIREYFAQTWDQAIARSRILAENTTTNADERCSRSFSRSK